MSQDQGDLQEQRTILEVERLETEIAKNRAEADKLALDAMEVSLRIRWSWARPVLLAIIGVAVLAATAVSVVLPLLDARREVTTLRNESFTLRNDLATHKLRLDREQLKQSLEESGDRYRELRALIIPSCETIDGEENLSTSASDECNEDLVSYLTNQIEQIGAAQLEAESLLEEGQEQVQTTANEQCLQDYISVVPENRTLNLEEGDRDKNFPEKDTGEINAYGILFTENNQPIGAAKFDYLSNGIVFKNFEAIDSTCVRTLDNDELQNWGTLQFRLGNDVYQIRLGYDGESIEVSYFIREASLAPKN